MLFMAFLKIFHVNNSTIPVIANLKDFCFLKVLRNERLYLSVSCYNAPFWLHSCSARCSYC